MKKQKVIVTGAAGIVGQNLMFELENNYDVTALNKEGSNLDILRKFHPSVKAIGVDLAVEGDWENQFEGKDVLVILHAQISAKDDSLFQRNNVDATKNVIFAAKKHKIKYIVHVSSSVVISVSNDAYTRTKKEQQEIVENSRIPYVVLRPPLMFGWFDRKHLGLLSKYLSRWPVFPIPGNGKYLRQPLFVRDFCKVIAACVKMRPKNKVYEIIGNENITYIDIIKTIKKVKKLHTLIIKIPIWMFCFMMDVYKLFVKEPPFTSDQLRALTAGDKFPVWNWWDFFKVKSTPFEEAMNTTQNGEYSKVEMEF